MDDYTYDTYDTYTSDSYDTYTADSYDGGETSGYAADTGCCACGPAEPTELPPVTDTTPDGTAVGNGAYSYSDDGGAWSQSPIAAPPPPDRGGHRVSPAERA